MSKLETEFLLKLAGNSNETQSEESKDYNTLKPTNTSLPLSEGDTIEVPLAMPEDDAEDINNQSSSEDVNDSLLDHKKQNDEIDLSDRAGEFPYAPGFGPNFNTFTTGATESIPDVNIYQHKKTIAQGMMDIALFSANANQLRYVLESSKHTYYYPGIVLISISLFFQVAVGVGLLWNTRYDVKDEKEICIANKVNNFTVVGIFLVTVVNVFISAFGTTAGIQPA